MNTPDHYDQFRSHEAIKQKWLESLPECSYCGKPIQDEKLCDFDGCLICIRCLERHYMKDADDYIA